MNEPGFAFLYALALIAMLLVNAIAVVMTLRQAIGTRLTGYQVYLFRNNIYTGLLCVLFSISVPAVLYIGVDPRITVSVVSAFMAVIITCYIVINIVRTSSYKETVSTHLWLIHLGRVLIALMLVVNALGIRYLGPVTWAPLSPITTAAFWELLAVGLDFALGLTIVGAEPERG